MGFIKYVFLSHILLYVNFYYTKLEKFFERSEICNDIFVQYICICFMKLKGKHGIVLACDKFINFFPVNMLLTPTLSISTKKY